MWIHTYSKIYQGLRKEDVWHLWTDINNWPSWHSDLEYCKMQGPCQVGNYFILKPKGVKAVKIVITNMIEGQELTDCTQFPGAKMYDTHKIEETPEGLRLTNIVRVTGPLQWLWVKLVAKNVAASHPHELDILADLARKRHA